MLGEIGGARIRELEIFALVAKTKSIREAARRAPTTPGQVSKTIQSLEKRVGVRLFKRSTSGALLTGEGTDLYHAVQELLERAEKMESCLSRQTNTESQRTLAIAGTAFLNTHLTTPLVCEGFGQDQEMHFRFLDLPPDQIVPIGLRSGFEIAVHFGALGWPSTWISERAGSIRWVLVARTDHPLRKKPTLKQILDCRFVVPTYWTSEGLTRGNDHFPVPMAKRQIGFETATADAAIPILQKTDQIAFLPDVLVKSFIQSRVLREIPMPGVETVKRDLYLSARSDLVSSNFYRRLLALVSKSINE